MRYYLRRFCVWTRLRSFCKPRAFLWRIMTPLPIGCGGLWTDQRWSKSQIVKRKYLQTTSLFLWQSPKCTVWACRMKIRTRKGKLKQWQQKVRLSFSFTKLAKQTFGEASGLFPSASPLLVADDESALEPFSGCGIPIKVWAVWMTSSFWEGYKTTERNNESSDSRENCHEHDHTQLKWAAIHVTWFSELLPIPKLAKDIDLGQGRENRRRPATQSSSSRKQNLMVGKKQISNANSWLVWHDFTQVHQYKGVTMTDIALYPAQYASWADVTITYLQPLVL